jgi:hypothetical protein
VPPGRELDVWLHSALRVAQVMNPYLAPDDLNATWPAFMVSRCYATLTGLQRRWLTLFRAVAARDAPAMGALAEELLASQRELSSEAREYLCAASSPAMPRRASRARSPLGRAREGVRRRRRDPVSAVRCHASASAARPNSAPTRALSESAPRRAFPHQRLGPRRRSDRQG